MSLIKVDWNPAETKLRQFGCCALVALPLIAWLFGGNQTVFLSLTAAGVGCALLGLLWPAGLRPVYLAAHVVTLPIGLVLGEVLLFAIYTLVFTPVALLFRMIGRDALQRRFQANATTYWVPRTQPTDVRRYYHQS